MEKSTPLLVVRDLTTKIQTKDCILPLIAGINFEIELGKTFVLLGESGSGKSITALSILRLLPPMALHGTESQILFEGQDLLTLPERKMRRIRGGGIAMIFQEPLTSLNPVLTVKDQIKETLLLHQKVKRKFLKNEIIQLLESVKISDPERVMECYPHQLSGGMKQRIMIAMALAGRPKLLIADEPTTSLDVTIQAEILKLLKELQKKYHMAILFITHDLGVAAHIADEVGVMQAGKMVEKGETTSILKNPQNPYTQQLISSSPQLKIEPIGVDSEVILTIEGLKIVYPIKNGFFRRTCDHIKAVDEVRLDLKEGETLALVGESGCGKTTLAKAVMSLIKPTSGEIIFLGDSLTSLSKRALFLKRSLFQIIFQDPFSAMDPRMQIKDILEEGMLAFKIGSDEEERLSRMDVLLEQVGLEPNHKYRYPHEFSGGQRQRICIARALAVGPRLLVCDEPTSSLDMTYQAQIIDLLIQLQHEFGLAYLFITHNFRVVKALAHRVAVMQAGKIVEEGETEAILQSPKHPYTQNLLKAVL